MSPAFPLIGRVLLVILAVADPPAPRAEYESLLREWKAAMEARPAREPRTPAERRVLIQAEGRERDALGQRFIALADRHPDDPVAARALVWVLGHMPSSTNARQAVDRLIAQQLDSRELVELCQGHIVVLNGPPPVERLFRALAENGKSPEARGWGSFALARHLAARARLVRRLGEDPELAARLKGDYDPRSYEELTARSPDALEEEAGTLFESVSKTCGGIKFESAGPLTLGEAARNALFEMRYLRIGKAAPEIRGEDIDGRPLTLSEFRGKVVVINFWGSWCGPCMALVDHERALVKRLEGKPFVLLGVNSDENRTAVTKLVRDKGITWRSWWDGGLPGPIARRWNVVGWPTTYVLDAQGIIRHRNVRGAALDRAVDQLLSEMTR